MTRRPDTLRTPGPHGSPLIVHAQKDGADAAPVLAYLQGLAPARAAAT